MEVRQEPVFFAVFSMMCHESLATLMFGEFIKVVVIVMQVVVRTVTGFTVYESRRRIHKHVDLFRTNLGTNAGNHLNVLPAAVYAFIMPSQVSCASVVPSRKETKKAEQRSSAALDK